MDSFKLAPGIVHLAMALLLSTTIVAGDLELRIATDKDTYAPFEPVVLEYELHNPSDTAQRFPGSVGKNSGWIKIEVGSDTMHPYRTGPIVCRASNGTLSAHGSRREQVIMISNQYGHVNRVGREPAPGYPFGEVGRHEIRAHYPKGGGDPQNAYFSNTLAIRVRDATEQEGQAIAFFDSPAELAVAMGGELIRQTDERPDSLDEVVDRWELFVQSFGDTTYAPFVRLNLARTYRVRRDVTAARPDIAMAHLREVIANGPASISDDALLELAKFAIDAGRVEEARQAVTKISRKYPNSEHSREAKRIAEGLDAGYRTLGDIFSH